MLYGGMIYDDLSLIILLFLIKEKSKWFSTTNINLATLFIEKYIDEAAKDFQNQNGMALHNAAGVCETLKNEL